MTRSHYLQFSRNTPTYGFNTVLLSNTSAALLDAPMPDNITSIQNKMNGLDSAIMSATVHGTVTTYNNSVESHRNQSKFWDTSLNTFGNGTSKYLYHEQIHNAKSLGLLMNQYSGNDETCCSAEFYDDPSDIDNQDKALDRFHENALQFSTHRASCHGTWSLTRDSVQLTEASCGGLLPETSQRIFTSAQFENGHYYVGSLIEYLGPFSITRNQSQWLVPSFSTLIASMYWSRATAKDGFYSWGTDKNASLLVDPTLPMSAKREEIYYPANDTVTFQRQTINRSFVLYLALAIQPILSTIHLLAGWVLYTVPLDNGFGMIALLAGVRPEGLKLLKGASLSGALAKPLRVKMLVHMEDEGEKNPGKKGHEDTRIEYVLGEAGRNNRIPCSSFLAMLFGSFITRNRKSRKTGRDTRPTTNPIALREWRDTRYERLVD